MIFRISDSDLLVDKDSNGKKIKVVKTARIQEFSPLLLGIGDVSKDSNQIEALIAIVDLKGFSKFCSQIDPYLAIPVFLSKFLNWLYLRLLEESTQIKTQLGTKLYANLPIKTKFLGDGVLFIWDVKGWSLIGINNVVRIMSIICHKYDDEFSKEISNEVSSAPTQLRCGIARGNIYTVGNGDDFIGPCINMASRLQKLGPFSFAISKRGFNCFENKTLTKELTIVKSNVRGIGNDELIYVLKSEYEMLTPDEKLEYPEAKT